MNRNGSAPAKIWLSETCAATQTQALFKPKKWFAASSRGDSN
jgi:hypothetical protein